MSGLLFRSETIGRFEKTSRKQGLVVNFEHVTQSHNSMDDGQLVFASEENLILILFRLRISFPQASDNSVVRNFMITFLPHRELDDKIISKAYCAAL